MRRQFLRLLSAPVLFLAPAHGAWAESLSAGDIVPGLPPDFSPWSMFLGAHIVVKGVMLGLALASLVTWTIGIAKGIEIRALRRAIAAALPELDNCRTLGEAAASPTVAATFGALIETARAEIAQSQGIDGAAGVKERIASRLQRIEAAAGRAIVRSTGVLATVGATAPFIGLFGTVWGIMNAFIGISRQHTTNLAVVAPGIAEALLATALGLVAAIPAVVIYNALSRASATWRALHADGSAAVFRIASRDLDRGQAIDRGQASDGAQVAPLRGRPLR